MSDRTANDMSETEIEKELMRFTRVAPSCASARWRQKSKHNPFWGLWMGYDPATWQPCTEGTTALWSHVSPLRQANLTMFLRRFVVEVVPSVLSVELQYVFFPASICKVTMTNDRDVAARVEAKGPQADLLAVLKAVNAVLGVEVGAQGISE